MPETPDEATLAPCPACRRTVSLHDDFVRLREQVYHLSCLLTALHQLGHEASDQSMHAAALSNGIGVLRNSGATG